MNMKVYCITFYLPSSLLLYFRSRPMQLWRLLLSGTLERPGMLGMMTGRMSNHQPQGLLTHPSSWICAQRNQAGWDHGQGAAVIGIAAEDGGNDQAIGPRHRTNHLCRMDQVCDGGPGYFTVAPLPGRCTDTWP